MGYNIKGGKITHTKEDNFLYRTKDTPLTTAQLEENYRLLSLGQVPAQQVEWEAPFMHADDMDPDELAKIMHRSRGSKKAVA
jgi:hypothetical protein